MAGGKLFSLLLLAWVFPALAQLDGGSGNFDPEVEELEAEPSVEKELRTDPTAKPDQGPLFESEPIPSSPAPGTLDRPKTSTAGKKPNSPRYKSDGGVIFDWTKHQNETEVAHPLVEKGLLRITRDKTYIYRVNETEQKTAAQVHFGQYYPSNLEAPADSNGNVSTFDDNYDQTDNPAVMVNWEWQMWKSPIGKWGLTAGGGVYAAQGNGHFVGTKNAGKTPLEIFTLAVIPVSVGAVYRMQFWDKQLLVPYAAGGGTLFAFGEFRDDNKAPKFGGSYGVYYAGGGALNLTYFDALSKIALDREYGINAVYLTAEYRSIVGLSPNFDFTGDFFNAGFLMEY